MVVWSWEGPNLCYMPLRSDFRWEFMCKERRK